MRVQNCADYKREMGYGEIMFAVYWSVDSANEIQLNFICSGCATAYTREGLVPGGRI